MPDKTKEEIDQEIEQYPLGVPAPNPFDPQKYTLAPIAAGAPEPEAFDFASGSGTKRPPKTNQGSSSSCTYHMLGNMFMILTGRQLSRRDGYSTLRSPDGVGAYMWQPFSNLKLNGLLEWEQGFPDPKKQTESNMTEIIVTDTKRKKWVMKYWQLSMTDYTVEGIARAIKAYKCVGGACYIQWEKWKDKEAPLPIDPSKPYDGSHAICFYDYGINDDDQPFVRAQPSWGDEGKYPKVHDFTSNNFQNALSNFHDFYVMEVGELMPDEDKPFYELVNNKGKIQLVLDFDTPENLAFLGKIHNFKVPVHRDPNTGKPVIGADGHIQIKWEEMNIRPVNF